MIRTQSIWPAPHPALSRLVITSLAAILVSAGCSNKMSLNSATAAANQGIAAGNMANQIGKHRGDPADSAAADKLWRAMAESNPQLYDLPLLSSGSLGLLYTTASFANKNGRWPNDYAELTNYVQQSNGYLILDDYQAVKFATQTNGGLEVRFISPGQTNETKFKLSPASHTR